MTNAASNTTSLFERIRPWKEFRASAKHLFPTDDSLRWLLRTHGPALEEAGAVLKLGRGIYVDPDPFKAVALDLMQQSAPSVGTAVGSTKRLV